MSATFTRTLATVRQYPDGRYLTVAFNRTPIMGTTADLMEAWIDTGFEAQHYKMFIKGTKPVAVAVTESVAKFVTKTRSSHVITKRVAVV